MPAWPPHIGKLWSAHPSGLVKWTAFPRGGQSWGRKTRAGRREPLPARRIFLSVGGWDPSPPPPRCLDSGGGRSGRTWAGPNCCCRICHLGKNDSELKVEDNRINVRILKNTKILLFTITYNHFLKINLTKLILKLYSKWKCWESLFPPLAI